MIENFNKTRQIQKFSILMILAAVSLFLRSYSGIRHDSILYFGQALKILYPTEFGADLFFTYGSQDSYTVFPKIISLALRVFSAGTVGAAGTILGQLIFALATYISCRVIIGKKYALLSLVFVLVWPSGYGGYGIFKYQEAFLTGRTFAEPLVILALALIYGRHLVASMAVLFLAALIHPLQAAPGIIIWFIYFLKKNHLKFFLLIAVAAMVSVFLKSSNFAEEIFLRYDDDWWNIIQEPNKHVFFSRWPFESVVTLAVDFFALFVARKFASKELVRLINAVLLCVVFSFASCLILVDFGKIILFTGLQLWRAQWVLHWFAIAMAPLVLFASWRGWQAKSVPPLLFVFSILVAAPMGSYANVYAALISIPLYSLWPFISSRCADRYQRLLGGALLLALLISVLRIVYAMYSSLVQRGASIWELLYLVVTHPLFAAPLIICSLLLIRRAKAAYIALPACLSFGLFLAALTEWDQRSPWSKALENNTYENVPFGHAIPSGSQIYWHGDLLAPWLVMHRASYWSNLQEAGVLFNRGTAIEAARRHEIFSTLELQSEICKTIKAFSASFDDCAPDDLVVENICKDANNELAYVVLPYKLKMPAVGEWRNFSAISGGKDIVDYLYQCSSFNKPTKGAL